MRNGRPRKIRFKKSFRRARGAARKGAGSPKQKSAAIGRRRVRGKR